MHKRSRKKHQSQSSNYEHNITGARKHANLNDVSYSNLHDPSQVRYMLADSNES